MSNLLTITRQQLAAFIKDPRTIKVFEMLFAQVLSVRPELTQYANPSASGFTIGVNNIVDNVPYDVWLLLTPAAGYAAGTINLPAASGCADKQVVSVTTTQIVTALTIGSNGAVAVVGAPTTLSANSTFRLRYDQPNNSWYIFS